MRLPGWPWAIKRRWKAPAPPRIDPVFGIVLFPWAISLLWLPEPMLPALPGLLESPEKPVLWTPPDPAPGKYVLRKPEERKAEELLFLKEIGRWIPSGFGFSTAT